MQEVTEWYGKYEVWAVTGLILAGIRWVSKKFKKIDETESIRADLDNHKKDYSEFKSDTKTRLDKLDERTYDQKK